MIASSRSNKRVAFLLHSGVENYFGGSSKIPTSTLQAGFSDAGLRHRVEEQPKTREQLVLKQSASMPDIVNKYSNILLSTMRQDKCQGDFCNFRVMPSLQYFRLTSERKLWCWTALSTLETYCCRTRCLELWWAMIYTSVCCTTWYCEQETILKTPSIC